MKITLKGSRLKSGLQVACLTVAVVSIVGWIELSFLSSTITGLPKWAAASQPYLLTSLPGITDSNASKVSEGNSPPVAIREGLMKVLTATFQKEADAVAKIEPPQFGVATPASTPLPPEREPQTEMGRAMVKAVADELSSVVPDAAVAPAEMVKPSKAQADKEKRTAK